MTGNGDGTLGCLRESGATSAFLPSDFGAELEERGNRTRTSERIVVCALLGETPTLWPVGHRLRGAVAVSFGREAADHRHAGPDVSRDNVPVDGDADPIPAFSRCREECIAVHRRVNHMARATSVLAGHDLLKALHDRLS